MPKQTPRYCRVNDHIQSDQFGHEPMYFDKWIKDQPLRIIDDTKTFLQVQSPDGETHSVHQGDVQIIAREEVKA